jgi:hypothetical protein
MGFECVYTVWNYYDGVRSGLAEYSGKPHYFHCEWNENEDDYADIFTLTPVDDETLSLAIEQWAIWLEWEHKFHKGELLQSTHPALPGQHQRYAELKAILDTRISESAHRTRARATFRPIANQSLGTSGTMRQLEVEWEDISNP